MVAAMRKFRLLVCGGRDFADSLFVYKFLDDFAADAHENGWEISLLINGDSPGADSHANHWGRERGVYCAPIRALWEFYHRAPKAGPLRNKVLMTLDPDWLIAFPGNSGTENMWTLAKSLGRRRLHADPAKGYEAQNWGQTHDT
jgi:hypothetical protein